MIDNIMLSIAYRYMARRCEFLEQFIGFKFNGGIGSGLGKNSVLLGSTVVEVMKREVINMSENFDYRHDRKKIQQVNFIIWLNNTIKLLS